ncbi:hypothetical protein AB0B45_15200 [Nonomuraea sp. NPDC049152]|uniref:hypothetical protein n=1 Tax=Nonomuraea sp. NPDC049152 TaxID=3154350 RepID=UPI0033E9C71C
MTACPALRVLSLGAGVQSSALLLLAIERRIPRFDIAETELKPGPIEDDHVEGCSPWSCRSGSPVLEGGEDQ